MYETTKTLDILRDDTYFKDEKGNLQWPDAFEDVFNEGKYFRIKFILLKTKKQNNFFLGDKQGLHIRSTFQLSMRALGGIIW
jgi:hypothetical protein